MEYFYRLFNIKHISHIVEYLWIPLKTIKYQIIVYEEENILNTFGMKHIKQIMEYFIAPFTRKHIVQTIE